MSLVHRHTHRVCKVRLIYNLHIMTIGLRIVWAIRYCRQKSPMFIVNSVVMHEAQHTQKTISNQAGFCWSTQRTCDLLEPTLNHMRNELFVKSYWNNWTCFLCNSIKYLANKTKVANSYTVCSSSSAEYYFIWGSIQSMTDLASNTGLLQEVKISCLIKDKYVLRREQIITPILYNHDTELKVCLHIYQ